VYFKNVCIIFLTTLLQPIMKSLIRISTIALFVAAAMFANAQTVTRSVILRPAGSTNTITIDPAAALTGSYTLTLPDAGIAATGPIMRVSTAGAARSVSFSQLNLGSNTAVTGDVTGTLGVTNGGTGLAALAAGALVYGSGGNAMNTLAPGTDGQVLQMSGGVPVWATPANVIGDASGTHTITAAQETAGVAVITPPASTGYGATSRIIVSITSSTPGAQAVSVSAQTATTFDVRASGLFAGDVINYIVVNP
jgi:hypothetical protein